jgi:hypothetical protein
VVVMTLAVTMVMPRTGHGRAAQRGDDEGGKDEGANHSYFSQTICSDSKVRRSTLSTG